MHGSPRTPTSFLFSLRGRLLFLICLATLPAILFTFFVAERERTAALLRTERDALHLADLASREHAHQILGVRKLLSWLGAKLSSEGPQSPIITDPSYLQSQLASHPQLANIGVLSPDGTVITSAHPLSSDRSWADNPAFLGALRSDDVVTGTYLISPIFERPTLNHAYAVRDAEQQVTAVLFSGLDLDWLSQLAPQEHLSEGFSLFVADRHGQVLAHDGSTSPRIPDDELRLPEISELSQSRRGRMLTIRGTTLRRYFVAAPLAEAPGLHVAVGLPYEQVVGQANSTFYRVLIGLSLLTLFTIAAVFVAAELGILRGLRSLAGAAQRLGRGELSARVRAPRGHHELASLAKTFNAMADSLAARHREAVDAQTRLRALAHRLQTAHETEAARISRELHDEIGQVLTSLKIDLSRLQSCCPPSEQARSCSTELRERAALMNEHINAAVDFVRRISSELRPGVLDKLGLAAAIEWHAREIEARTDLAVQVEVDDAEISVEALVSVTLFRIAQEAITNVVRHAEAHAVEIHLSTTKEAIVLTIRDDGKGIAQSAVDSDESLGILGMRERAMLIGGHLSVRGVAGQGTTVRVTAPRTLTPEVTDADSAG